MRDESTTGTSDRKGSERRHLRTTIALILIGWTLLYNVLIKEQGIVEAFFSILDTISDDFVMGTTLTVGIGLGIVFVFSGTKLYTQIISNIYSFRILEDLLHNELRSRQYREFFRKLMNFEDLPLPDSSCPKRVSSLVFALSFIYAMSLVYVVLFCEALFFLSWSAGVNLEIPSPDVGDPRYILTQLPMLALAIPFSARVMAYARYRYAQDYADFMPGAVFVFLIVSALGLLFESDDQKVFLEQVWASDLYRRIFIRNGVFLAFIPVFFEGAFWLYELHRQSGDQDIDGIDDDATGPRDL